MLKNKPLASAEDTLVAMHDLIIKLKDVYSYVILAMQHRDTQTFLNLQPTKELLSREYEVRAREIQARTTSIKLADPALRAKVIVAQEELDTLATESETLSLRMAEVARRLHERLIDAARYAIKQEKIRYGSGGMMAEAAAGRPIATAINEAI